MNIKIIFTSAAALAMVAGTPAFAAKGNQNDQASAAAADGGQQGEKKIKGKLCRTFDTTESRMGRTRLCLTPAEWKKFDDEQG
ncbi:MAG TPA: hypothetical protein VF650_12610 [Allosphingosinicella sp.]|jgi:hypothetical protein